MTGHWRTLETEDGTLHIDLREVVAIYGEPTAGHLAVYLRGGVELIGVVGDADTLRDAVTMLRAAEGGVSIRSADGAEVRKLRHALVVLDEARGIVGHACTLCGDGWPHRDGCLVATIRDEDGYDEKMP